MKPLMMMRTSGLSGPRFANHAGIPGLSKSAGNSFDESGSEESLGIAFVPDANHSNIILIFRDGPVTATDITCGWRYRINGGTLTAPNSGLIGGAGRREVTLVIPDTVVCSDELEIEFNPAGCDLAIDGTPMPELTLRPMINNVISPTPVIDIEPQHQVVTAPDPATFTVTATGADSYQWLENGVEMPGETSNSLIISPTDTGMSGNNYACNCINDCGATRSAIVFLTVN